jgi:GNAT superfamily N-acetyltransferase
MTLAIRTARPDEYDAVGELTLRAYQGGPALHDSDGPYVAELLDAARRAAEAELLVAEEPDRPGELLATVTVCRAGTPWAEIARPGEIELRMLAVPPEHRGGGVARAVMAAMRTRARAEDAVLVVSVIDFNAPAHALYRSLGFERQPDRDWRPTPEILLQVYRDAGGD